MRLFYNYDPRRLITQAKFIYGNSFFQELFDSLQQFWSSFPKDRWYFGVIDLDGFSKSIVHT
jgi:hypothetical protein